MQFRAQPAVDAKKLLVHESGERESTEGFHAGFVDGPGILALAF